jgi:N6-L-threonylcarbamoyladenine synthase
MKILGIETSCDETACAIVEDGRRILSNVVASQIDIHAKTGGVVPEVAAREHVLKMLPVLDECLKVGGCGWEDIDALSVTRGPGLVSSLIIGTQTANVISYVKKKPLIPVQHIIGHIYSNWLFDDGVEMIPPEPEFPALILTVSGGHNELILMNGHYDFEVLGETRDDAAGEAFDKVARLLGLGYPGGPVISKTAEDGNPEKFDFPVILLEKDSFDFSFSGLKTAVLTEIKKHEGQISDQLKADVAASFEMAVVKTFGIKLQRAVEKFPQLKEVHLAGGVSANRKLREVAAEYLPESVKFRYPEAIKYCTDNASMIASAAYFQYQLNPTKYPPSKNIVPSTSFDL